MATGKRPRFRAEASNASSESVTDSGGCQYPESADRATLVTRIVRFLFCLFPLNVVAPNRARHMSKKIVNSVKCVLHVLRMQLGALAYCAQRNQKLKQCLAISARIQLRCLLSYPVSAAEP